MVPTYLPGVYPASHVHSFQEGAVAFCGRGMPHLSYFSGVSGSLDTRRDSRVMNQGCTLGDTLLLFSFFLGPLAHQARAQP